MLTTAEIEITGKSEQGRLGIYNRHHLNEWLRQNSGRAFTAKFRIIDPPSAQLIGYYWAEVVPRFQFIFSELGEYLSKEETEQRIRGLSPVPWDESEEGGDILTEARKVNELTATELRAYISDLIRIAAADFYTIINTPL